MTDTTPDYAGLEALEQAIIGYWGNRCSDFDGNCPCCQSWKQFDALRALLESNAELERELEMWREVKHSSHWKTRAEAAEARLTSERAAHAETKRERDEAFQKYVDANEARIDAEAQRDEAMKALDALDRMNRGLDWCDQDEQARRWSAARRALAGGQEE